MEVACVTTVAKTISPGPESPLASGGEQGLGRIAMLGGHPVDLVRWASWSVPSILAREPFDIVQERAKNRVIPKLGTASFASDRQDTIKYSLNEQSIDAIYSY